ncbi:hypothetical protein H4R20_005767, partial [Coemansia guatemalensis]
MQSASEYTVEARDRPILRIQLHEESPGTRLGGNTHPWHALFEQPDALQNYQSNSCGQPLTQGQAPNNNIPAQRAASSTADCAATGNATEPLCYMGSAQSGQRANAPSACPAIYADEINTQGLLDGLEDLYDFGDEDTKPSEACNATTKSSNDNTSTRDDNACLDHLDDMDPDEADAIISQLGAFESAKASLEFKADTKVKEENGVSDHKLPADTSKRQAVNEVLDTLADMSEGEAERIVGSLGGFSKPPQIPSKCGIHITKRPVSSSSRSDQAERGAPDINTQLHEIPEMEDAEARSIIQSLGGFSRPPNRSGDDSDTTSLSSKSAITAAAPQTSSTSQACPPSPRTPTTPVPCQRQGIAGQAISSRFPSKRDVLSARRALKMDSGKAQVPAFSPPVRMGAGRPVAPAPGTSARDAAQASESKRQLAFKLPGIKRPAAKLRFNSPTKRLALDSGQTGNGQGMADTDAGAPSDGSNNGDCRPAVQLIQFSQPFRSPAKTNPDSPRNREANQRLLNRGRAPPVLPH